MKLRNKKTGEIKELKDVMSDMIDNHIVPTLIAIENEWEDYEEPKDYWYIDLDGEILSDGCVYEDGTTKSMKQIGNYFETKEEAEKALEKLKAFKRLKDKGFRFEKWTNVSAGPYSPIWFYFEKDTILDDVKSDLDLLFIGEE